MDTQEDLADIYHPIQNSIESLTHNDGIAFYGSNVSLSVNAADLHAFENQRQQIAAIHDAQIQHSSDTAVRLRCIESGMMHLQRSHGSLAAVDQRLRRMERALLTAGQPAPLRSPQHSAPMTKVKKPIRLRSNKAITAAHKTTEKPAQDNREKIVRLIKHAYLTYEAHGNFVKHPLVITDPDYERASSGQRLQMIRQIQALRLLIWLFEKPCIWTFEPFARDQQSHARNSVLGLGDMAVRGSMQRMRLCAFFGDWLLQIHRGSWAGPQDSMMAIFLVSVCLAYEEIGHDAHLDFLLPQYETGLGSFTWRGHGHSHGWHDMNVSEIANAEWQWRKLALSAPLGDGLGNHPIIGSQEYAEIRVVLAPRKEDAEESSTVEELCT